MTGVQTCALPIYVIVHGIDFRTGESEQRAIEVYVLTPCQFRVETYAELDKGNQFAMDLNGAIVRTIDLRDELQQCGFATAVASDDAEELA